MKKSTFLSLFTVLFVAIMIFNGCSKGGGDSSNSEVIDTNTPKEANFPGIVFPEVNEDELLNSNDKTQIETTADDNSVVTLVATNKDKLVVSETDLISNNIDSGYIIVSPTVTVSASNIGNPLFVGESFYGLITEVIDETNQLRIKLKNAENIDDVYGTLTIEVRNNAIKRSVQRSINTHKIKGIYDDINVHPLRFTLLKKPVTNKRGLTEDEIILRMDIPKGYHIPIQQRSLSCSFSSAECSFTVKSSESEKLDLGKKYENGGITFSTEGSYIEMGLGAYMKVHYDENLIANDIFDFTLAQSGYFKSNMQVSISGKLEKDWSTNLKLIKDFDVEIIHPYSAVVKTSIAVAPVVTFGVSGKLEGSVTATSYLERSGEMRFQYDSTADSKDFLSTLKYTPKSLDKDGVEVEVKAEAHAYILPSFLMIPNVKILRINIPMTLVYMRSGVKLDNAINGVIKSGFVVKNGEEQDSLDSEVSVTTALSGSFQGRWMVKLGSIDFYHTDDYIDLATTGELVVLEWKSQLLHKPEVVVKEDSENPQIRNITFTTDESSKIKEKLYFYYTVADKNEATYDIPTEGIENHKLVWRIGDAPIVIESNKIVKVCSVLYNKDISDSTWSWGTSISEQTTAEVVTMMVPTINPSSTSFKDSLSISMTQSQNYDIYYKVNGGEAQLYQAPFDITQTTTISAYASATIDGEKVFSKEITASYTLCSEDEDLVGGSCVEHEDPIIATPIATPSNPEFTESVDVYLSSSDGGYIFYSIDGGEWISYSGAITLTDSATIYAYVDSDPTDLNAIYSEVAMFSYSKIKDNSGDDSIGSNNGKWVLYDQIFVNGCSFWDESWGWKIVSCSGGEGSYSFVSQYEDNEHRGTASYTVPPSTLLEGKEYAFVSSFTGEAYPTIDVKFYKTYVGLSFSDHGDANLDAEWSSKICSNNSSKSYTIPTNLNHNGALVIEAGSSMGYFESLRDTFYLYKWEE